MGWTEKNTEQEEFEVVEDSEWLPEEISLKKEFLVRGKSVSLVSEKTTKDQLNLEIRKFWCLLEITFRP